MPSNSVRFFSVPQSRLCFASGWTGFGFLCFLCVSCSWNSFGFETIGKALAKITSKMEALERSTESPKNCFCDSQNQQTATESLWKLRGHFSFHTESKIVEMPVEQLVGHFSMWHFWMWYFFGGMFGAIPTPKRLLKTPSCWGNTFERKRCVAICLPDGQDVQQNHIWAALNEGENPTTKFVPTWQRECSGSRPFIWPARRHDIPHMVTTNRKSTYNSVPTVPTVRQSMVKCRQIEKQCTSAPAAPASFKDSHLQR